MAEIGSALKDSAHLVAIVESAEAVLAGVDLSPLLMYFIDTTSPEALPYLADQFGVLGFKGWAIAEGEVQQRELLKKALELQRHKGTPWAIKEVLKTVGFGGAEIEEGGTGYSPLYNAEYIHDGSIEYGGAARYEWATFNIIFDIGEERGITADETALALKVVNEYKNARSRLIGIAYGATISETAIIDDDGLSYAVQGPTASDTIRGLIYDGSAIYNGVETHEGTAGDSAFLQVRNAGGTIIEIDNF